MRAINYLLRLLNILNSHLNITAHMAPKLSRSHKQSLYPESSKYEDHRESDQSELGEDAHQFNFDENAQQDYQQANQKLSEQNEQLLQQISQYKHKNKEMKDAIDIAEIRLAKHEEKQRELIKKLSHEQITNRQLEYEFKKMAEQLSRAKESSKVADHRNYEANSAYKRSQEERNLFIKSFKKVSQAISRCERIEDFNSCMKKFGDFLKQNMKNYEATDSNTEFEFDLKFELNQINGLRQKNAELEGKVWKLKEELEKEKQEKKRIVASYNDKLSKLREHCDELRAKVEDRDEDNSYEITNLKKIINDKNEVISDLKFRIETEQKRKESVCSRKSRVRKRSFFIGDGEKDANGFKMSQLENQIEQLERELIQELQQ